MKLSYLLESYPESKIIKAVRMMKFSMKNGENSLGVDLANAKCKYYFMQGKIMFIGKLNALDTDKLYRFENAEKPGFSADRNSKLGNMGIKVIKTIDNLPDAITYLRELGNVSIVIDPELTTGAKPVVKDKPESPEDVKDGFYVLSYWGDPYKAGNKEYFWGGAFHDRKNALAYAKNKQDRGQPKGFTNWVKGTVTVIHGQEKFVTAANKVGLKPNVSDVRWFD